MKIILENGTINRTFLMKGVILFMEAFDTYMINKIFTVPYFDKMISENSIPEVFHLCKRYIKTEQATVGEVISEIYHFMDGNYRNEYFYKNTILNQLMIQKHDLYSTAALTELPIGESKADFIMINGKGVVYEIKTDLDNLNRLESQIRDYYKVFSYVYVVTGSKQLQHVKEYLKESKAGIYELTAKGQLICRKKALSNRQYLSHEAMFRVLRKGEFESVLLKHYGKLPEVNSFLYYRECQKLIAKINIVTLQKDVMECLKARTLLFVENKLEEVIPYELRFYSYFSKRYKTNYREIDLFCSERMEV